MRTNVNGLIRIAGTCMALALLASPPALADESLFPAKTPASEDDQEMLKVRICEPSECQTKPYNPLQGLEFIFARLQRLQRLQRVAMAFSPSTEAISTPPYSDQPTRS